MAWSRAEGEVRAFLERTQIPFLRSPMGKGVVPDDHPLSVAAARTGRLVEEAAAGEPVCITRRGKAVAQITAVDTPRKRIDVAALRAMTDAMPVQPATARDFIRRMRDEDRY